MEKIKPRLIQAFYILFAVCFTFIIINVIFKNPYHKTVYLIPVTAVCITGLFFMYKLSGKYEALGQSADGTRYKEILGSGKEFV